MADQTPSLIIDTVTLKNENFDGGNLPKWRGNRSPQVRQTRASDTDPPATIEVWRQWNGSDLELPFHCPYLTVAQYDALVAIARSNPPVAACQYLGESFSATLRLEDHGYIDEGWFTDTHRDLSGTLKPVTAPTPTV